MVEELLKKLDLTPGQIELVAVARGPGSFTGVRIGVSIAKGLAWGLDIPVCGVSTLEAMAYQTVGYGALICPVMDARRNQIYNALFEEGDSEPIRLCDDRAISLETLADELQARKSFVCLIGDGAGLCFDHLTASGISGLTAPESKRYQTAHGVALAALRAAHMPAAGLEPCYLRPSQAERERSGG